MATKRILLETLISWTAFAGSALLIVVLTVSH